MFLQDYLWLDIETDNDSAICPHNLLFQGEASGVKGSRSVLWKECWIQLFIGVNDNVWLSVENELVTVSAGPVEGWRWRWGVLMLFLRELKPLAVWSGCRKPYWEQCKGSVAIPVGSLGRPGQDFSKNLLPGFSARWYLEVSCWAEKAEFTVRSLIQSPWKIMERIYDSGKILCQAKTKLYSGGDFPWSCKLPARLCLSEYSHFIWCQANLWNSQALIITLFRLMETWKNFS